MGTNKKQSLGFLLALLATGILSIVVYGLVIQKLWAWFIVPTFIWLPFPFLTLKQAIGLDLLWAVFAPSHYREPSGDSAKEFGISFSMGLVKPLILFGIAALIHSL